MCSTFFMYSSILKCQILIAENNLLNGLNFIAYSLKVPRRKETFYDEGRFKSFDLFKQVFLTTFTNGGAAKVIYVSTYVNGFDMITVLFEVLIDIIVKSGCSIYVEYAFKSMLFQRATEGFKRVVAWVFNVIFEITFLQPFEIVNAVIMEDDRTDMNPMHYFFKALKCFAGGLVFFIAYPPPWRMNGDGFKVCKVTA